MEGISWMLMLLKPACILQRSECVVLECNIHTSSFRCIAVCSLGLWVCEELMQKNIHQQVKDAISVLGVTLKVSNPLRIEIFIYVW